ncbi:MAG: hypothetical protein FWC68_05965, partial [Oscillospiraceae bacterium]|nr:hypothetical protein [Oscillospiraceae bacterium]
QKKELMEYEGSKYSIDPTTKKRTTIIKTPSCSKRKATRYMLEGTSIKCIWIERQKRWDDRAAVRHEARQSRAVSKWNWGKGSDVPDDRDDKDR